LKKGLIKCLFVLHIVFYFDFFILQKRFQINKNEFIYSFIIFIYILFDLMKNNFFLFNNAV